MEQNTPNEQPVKPVNKCADGHCMNNNKICAALSYLVIGIIWFFLDEEMKKDQFVKFHVKQGIVLVVASIIIQIIGTAIPFLGWFIILPLGNLLVLVLFIIGVANAASNKTKELPLIGKFAKKITSI